MATDLGRARQTDGRVRELVRSWATWVHGVVPKADDAVLWGWPDHEDSIVALEAALQDTAVRRVVVLMSDPSSPPPVPFGPKTVVLAKASIRGVLAFARARYAFFTHRCYLRRFSDRVVAVNVWHGMPVKRIGWMLEGDSGIACRHTVATSASWADIMERAMRPTRSVLVTGLPRNDRLSVDRDTVRAALGIGDRAEPLAVWLPTYRRTVQGMPAVDGHGSDSPFGMDDVDPACLDRALAEIGMVALVKPHPLARGVAARDHANLLVVDDPWLVERGLTLYDVVGAADVLVTDFSSVVVDYVLVDRPIVHAIADLEEYRRSRGFSVEPVEAQLAGPVATTPGEVVDALAAVARGEDPWAQTRRQLRDRWHDHPDFDSTGRLLDAVGLSTREHARGR